VGEFAATKPGPPTLGRRITKALPSIAALVFVAGGIAVLIAYFGNTAHETTPKTPPGAGIDNSIPPKNVAVPNGAKTVAAKYITAAMTRAKGNQTVAARLLGLSRRTLSHCADWFCISCTATGYILTSKP